VRFGDQQRQRAADGDAADTVRARQVALGGQEGCGRDVAIQNRFTEPVGDAVGEILAGFQLHRVVFP
jgi:hypothetical protein